MIVVSLESLGDESPIEKQKGRTGAAPQSWQGCGCVGGVEGSALGYLIHAAQHCDGPQGLATIESFQLFT